MLVAAMNTPAFPLEDELRRIAAGGFDVVDLTLEPPGAWPVDAADLRRLLDELGLAAVGHTPPYLPIASPYAALAAQAREIHARTWEVFAAIGLSLVNIHPDPMSPMFSLTDVRERNAEAIAALVERARAHGLRLMVENLGRSFNTVDDLEPILDADEELGFHLDVGHANIRRGPGQPGRSAELLAAFGSRLAHVHVHDNVGVEDLHLPLGLGTVDWPSVVQALKDVGWDGPVTIEIHGCDDAYLELSRRRWLEWWNG